MQFGITIAAVVCSLLALAGAIYFALCVWAAQRFPRQTELVRRVVFEPPASILKSLKGLDPRMYEAFRSHCRIDYGEFELLFGVSDPNEPALALVTRLQQEFPHRRIRVIHCPQSLGMNGKVSNLAQVVPQA